MPSSEGFYQVQQNIFQERHLSCSTRKENGGKVSCLGHHVWAFGYVRTAYCCRDCFGIYKSATDMQSGKKPKKTWRFGGSMSVSPCARSMLSRKNNDGTKTQMELVGCLILTVQESAATAFVCLKLNCKQPYNPVSELQSC